MGLIRIIILALFVYVIIRLVRTLYRIFSSSSRQSSMHEPKQKKSKIDKKDIIEADFEEIKDQEKENSQN
ncbi:hypothetical protein ASZ90_003193 [hydrocarbon metagenome]|uniref:Uncharacterized protein n=1 Tax=hydrocarbon metagenome TaxID=938273 RepID=A0A0W8G1G1_9ZZZZ